MIGFHTLLDDPVGLRQQHRRHDEVGRLRGLEAECRFDGRRLPNRQVGCLAPRKTATSSRDRGHRGARGL